jgi:hypothetical protein
MVKDIESCYRLIGQERRLHGLSVASLTDRTVHELVYSKSKELWPFLSWPEYQENESEVEKINPLLKEADDDVLVFII